MKQIKQIYLNIKKSIIDFIFKLINLLNLKFIIFINKIIINYYKIKRIIIILLIIKINKIKGICLKIKIILLFKIFSFVETLKNVCIKIKKIIIKIIKLYIKMILRSTLISWFIIYIYPYFSIGDIFMFSILGLGLVPYEGNQQILSPILEDGDIDNTEEEERKRRRERRREKRKYLNKPLPVIVTDKYLPPDCYRESYNLDRIERDMTKLFMNSGDNARKHDLTPTEEILVFQNREHRNNINNFDWRLEPIIPTQSPTLANSLDRIDWRNCTLSDPNPGNSIWIDSTTRNNPLIPNYSRFSEYSDLPESTLYTNYVQDTYGIRNFNYESWLKSTEEKKSLGKRFFKWIKNLFINKNKSEWWD